MDNSVVKSVGRVLGVLELFKDRRTPMTATDICNQLQLPKSSANALLKSLVTLGYLSLNSPGKYYYPTLAVTHLGDWLPGKLFGSAETLNVLEDVHAETQETVTLSMPNGLSMQFVTVLPSTFPISLNLHEGFLTPLFGSGVGTAQLSTRTDEEIARLVKQANRRVMGSKQKVDIAQVMVDVEEARNRGYAESYDHVSSDSGAIAMPIPRGEIDRNLVIAVGGLSARIRDRQDLIIRAMRRALRSIQ